MLYREFLLSSIGMMSSPLLLSLFFVIIAWTAVWKGIALWKSGRNNQLAWFIALLILNTLGVLEIVYLLFFQKKPRETRAGVGRARRRKR